ncbi:hypothetical protein BLOT_011052 [Blomia tropicalis]|nr:hypothetical protein BLOT_011052 [Blomia tropicalis]
MIYHFNGQLVNFLISILLTATFAHCANTNDTEIVSNNTRIDDFNLTTTFYEVDRANLTTSGTLIDLEDEYWDTPTTNKPALSGRSLNRSDEVSVVTFRVTVTTTPSTTVTASTASSIMLANSTVPGNINSTTSSSASTETETPLSATTLITTQPSIPSPTTTSRPNRINPTTLATVRLHSNILTLKPIQPVITSTTPTTTTTTTTSTTTTNSPTTSRTTTLKPKKNKFKPKNDFNGLGSEGEEDDDPINNSWRMTLHGTNMNTEELKMCNKTLLAIHFKPYSRRKVARQLKKELDYKFKNYNYRFSIIVSSTSRNTMGKALHGVWMSVSLNGVHYFITATYRTIEGYKMREDQLNKIEYWSVIHEIGAHNMTGYRKYNRIASKMKMDLDRQFGNGNVWSVVIVKNRYLVKAKVFEDVENHMEFSRLNSGHYIVFRGGQNIDDGARNARYKSMNDEIDDDETSEHSFREYVHNRT